MMCMFTSYKFDHTVRHADTFLYCKQQDTRTRMAYCYLNKLFLSNVNFFCHTLTLQNHVYKLSAQVARLTALCIEFSIKLPTIWCITTLVPQGMQRIFVHGSPQGTTSDGPVLFISVQRYARFCYITHLLYPGVKMY